MHILALVGSSGTGKSHRAIAIAHNYDMDAIIDDGLLITGSEIVAGKSAKHQATKIGAIRTALFSDADHAQEVNDAISEYKLSRILILGTSRAMINRICNSLGLQRPNQYLEIDTIATPEEIRQALSIRKHQGKHIVPAPTVEVKPRLSGTIIEPVRTFFQRKQQSTSHQEKRLWVEQSVVKPTFNSLGKFYIANPVLSQLITYATEQQRYVVKASKIHVDTTPGGVEFSLDIIVEYNTQLPKVAEHVQQAVVDSVEHMTALHVIGVNVTIRKLTYTESISL